MKPEDIAEIKTKKMTLHLDLTEEQQKKVRTQKENERDLK